MGNTCRYLGIYIKKILQVQLPLYCSNSWRNKFNSTNAVKITAYPLHVQYYSNLQKVINFVPMIAGGEIGEFFSWPNFYAGVHVDMCRNVMSVIRRSVRVHLACMYVS